MLVAGYFTKLKGQWDEFSSYNNLPLRSCRAMKETEDKEQRGEVM